MQHNERNVSSTNCFFYNTNSLYTVKSVMLLQSTILYLTSECPFGFKSVEHKKGPKLARLKSIK